MNICAFPNDLDGGIIADMLRGGAEKVQEAGAVVAGGHTVDDKEPKYGLSVLGFAHLNSIMTRGAARPGDTLVLTKPLGTGIITTAGKNRKAEAIHIDGAIGSMVRLSRDAAAILVRERVRACTDITGFGFLGHAYEMSKKSGVGLKLSASAMPFLPGAHRYAKEELFPGGTAKNMEAFGQNVRFDESVETELRKLLFTPETSGGLCAAVPAAKTDKVLAAFEAAGVFCRVLGTVVDGKGIEITP